MHNFKINGDVAVTGQYDDAHPLAIRRVSSTTKTRVTLDNGHVYYLNAYGRWAAYGKTPAGGIRAVRPGDVAAIDKTRAELLAKRELDALVSRVTGLGWREVSQLPVEDLRAIVAMLDRAKG